jgi:serine O-acetyltransferase
MVHEYQGLSTRYLIAADRRAYGMTPLHAVVSLVTISPFWLVACYRTAAALQRRRVPILPSLLHTLGVSQWGADISPSADIGPGFRISHTVGVVVGGQVTARRSLWLFQGVRIGGRDSVGMPTIGDDVTVYSGAIVMGEIRIGSRCRIGANAVVFKDLPSDVTATGNPAVSRPSGR